MARQHVSEQELLQQITEGIDQQRFARNTGTLRVPDDVDLDNGRMQLTRRLRTAISVWVSRRPAQDDLKVWQGVIADELMFLAATMFAFDHRNDSSDEISFELEQFISVMQSAVSEARWNDQRNSARQGFES
jgi:hypothetical protein